MPNSETIAPLRRARHACIHEGHFDDQVLRERAFFAAPAARSETSEFEPFSPPAAPSDARDRTRSEKDAAQPENSSHDIAKSDMLAAEPKKNSEEHHDRYRTRPDAQLSPEALAQVRIFQQNEVTESEVYRRIAAGTKDESNRAALLRIADEEAKHAAIWQRYTGEAMKPQRGKVLRFSLIARVFGFHVRRQADGAGRGEGPDLVRGAGERSARGAGHPRRRGIATSRRCWRCWTRSACRTWAAWCWA